MEVAMLNMKMAFMDKNRVSRSSYYIVVCLWDQLVIM